MSIFRTVRSIYRTDEEQLWLRYFGPTAKIVSNFTVFNNQSSFVQEMIKSFPQVQLQTLKTIPMGINSRDYLISVFKLDEDFTNQQVAFMKDALKDYVFLQNKSNNSFYISYYLMCIMIKLYVLISKNKLSSFSNLEILSIFPYISLEFDNDFRYLTSLLYSKVSSIEPILNPLNSKIFLETYKSFTGKLPFIQRYVLLEQFINKYIGSLITNLEAPLENSEKDSLLDSISLTAEFKDQTIIQHQKLFISILHQYLAILKKIPSLSHLYENEWLLSIGASIMNSFQRLISLNEIFKKEFSNDSNHLASFLFIVWYFDNFDDIYLKPEITLGNLEKVNLLPQFNQTIDACSQIFSFQFLNKTEDIIYSSNKAEINGTQIISDKAQDILKSFINLISTLNSPSFVTSILSTSLTCVNKTNRGFFYTTLTTIIVLIKIIQQLPRDFVAQIVAIDNFWYILFHIDLFDQKSDKSDECLELFQNFDCPFFIHNLKKILLSSVGKLYQHPLLNEQKYYIFGIRQLLSIMTICNLPSSKIICDFLRNVSINCPELMKTIFKTSDQKDYNQQETYDGKLTEKEINASDVPTEFCRFLINFSSIIQMQSNHLLYFNSLFSLLHVLFQDEDISKQFFNMKIFHKYTFSFLFNSNCRSFLLSLYKEKLGNILSENNQGISYDIGYLYTLRYLRFLLAKAPVTLTNSNWVKLIEDIFNAFQDIFKVIKNNNISFYSSNSFTCFFLYEKSMSIKSWLSILYNLSGKENNGLALIILKTIIEFSVGDDELRSLLNISKPISIIVESFNSQFQDLIYYSIFESNEHKYIKNPWALIFLYQCTFEKPEYQNVFQIIYSAVTKYPINISIISNSFFPEFATEMIKQQTLIKKQEFNDPSIPYSFNSYFEAIIAIIFSQCLTPKRFDHFLTSYSHDIYSSNGSEESIVQYKDWDKEMLKFFYKLSKYPHSFYPCYVYFTSYNDGIWINDLKSKFIQNSSIYLPFSITEIHKNQSYLLLSAYSDSQEFIIYLDGSTERLFFSFLQEDKTYTKINIFENFTFTTSQYNLLFTISSTEYTFILNNNNRISSRIPGPPLLGNKTTTIVIGNCLNPSDIKKYNHIYNLTPFSGAFSIFALFLSKVSSENNYLKTQLSIPSIESSFKESIKYICSTLSDSILYYFFDISNAQICGSLSENQKYIVSNSANNPSRDAFVNGIVFRWPETLSNRFLENQTDFCKLVHTIQKTPENIKLLFKILFRIQDENKIWILSDNIQNLHFFSMFSLLPSSCFTEDLFVFFEYIYKSLKQSVTDQEILKQSIAAQEIMIHEIFLNPFLLLNYIEDPDNTSGIWNLHKYFEKILIPLFQINRPIFKKNTNIQLIIQIIHSLNTKNFSWKDDAISDLFDIIFIVFFYSFGNFEQDLMVNEIMEENDMNFLINFFKRFLGIQKVYSYEITSLFSKLNPKHVPIYLSKFSLLISEMNWTPEVWTSLYNSFLNLKHPIFFQVLTLISDHYPLENLKTLVSTISTNINFQQVILQSEDIIIPLCFIIFKLAETDMTLLFDFCSNILINSLNEGIQTLQTFINVFRLLMVFYNFDGTNLIRNVLERVLKELNENETYPSDILLQIFFIVFQYLFFIPEYEPYSTNNFELLYLFDRSISPPEIPHVPNPQISLKDMYISLFSINQETKQKLNFRFSSRVDINGNNIDFEILSLFFHLLVKESKGEIITHQLFPNSSFTLLDILSYVASEYLALSPEDYSLLIDIWGTEQDLPQHHLIKNDFSVYLLFSITLNLPQSDAFKLSTVLTTLLIDATSQIITRNIDFMALVKNCRQYLLESFSLLSSVFSEEVQMNLESYTSKIHRNLNPKNNQNDFKNILEISNSVTIEEFSDWFSHLYSYISYFSPNEKDFNPTSIHKFENYIDRNMIHFSFDFHSKFQENEFISDNIIMGPIIIHHHGKEKQSIGIFNSFHACFGGLIIEWSNILYYSITKLPYTIEFYSKLSNDSYCITFSKTVFVAIQIFLSQLDEQIVPHPLNFEDLSRSWNDGQISSVQFLYLLNICSGNSIHIPGFHPVFPINTTISEKVQKRHPDEPIISWPIEYYYFPEEVSSVSDLDLPPSINEFEFVSQNQEFIEENDFMLRRFISQFFNINISTRNHVQNPIKVHTRTIRFKLIDNDLSLQKANVYFSLISMTKRDNSLLILKSNSSIIQVSLTPVGDHSSLSQDILTTLDLRNIGQKDVHTAWMSPNLLAISSNGFGITFYEIPEFKVPIQTALKNFRLIDNGIINEILKINNSLLIRTQFSIKYIKVIRKDNQYHFKLFTLVDCNIDDEISAIAVNEEIDSFVVAWKNLKIVTYNAKTFEIEKSFFINSTNNDFCQVKLFSQRIITLYSGINVVNYDFVGNFISIFAIEMIPKTLLLIPISSTQEYVLHAENQKILIFDPIKSVNVRIVEIHSPIALIHYDMASRTIFVYEEDGYMTMIQL